MGSAQDLTEAHVLLLAAHFISEVDVQSLQTLAVERNDILTEEIIYRLLLTLFPTDEVARDALLALLRNIKTKFDNVSSIDSQVDTTFTSSIPPKLASQEARRLRLLPLNSHDHDRTNQLLTAFVIAWAHHVEDNDRGLSDLLPIVEEFQSGDAALASWARTFLIPLYRLKYEFYHDTQMHLNLRRMQTLSGIAGVRTLLEHAEGCSANADVARDLDEVVLPWIEGLQEGCGAQQAGMDQFSPSASWEDVNVWIFETSLKNFKFAATALLKWQGPPQLAKHARSKSNLSQTAFAVVYAMKELNADTLRLSMEVLKRAVSLLGTTMSDISTSSIESGAFAAFQDNVSDADLLINNLMGSENTLTNPTHASIMFLDRVLRTAELLTSYRLPMTPSDIARLCLTSSDERQKQELRRILQQIPQLTGSRLDWTSVRQQILWLQSWVDEAGQETLLRRSSDLPTFLGRLAPDLIEKEVLESILSQGEYSTAKGLYLDSQQLPLPESIVEGRVVDAIYTAYDNASNGNRTRGGIKRASELLNTFRPIFRKSDHLAAIDYLLKATHSLSFYHLTLQHGVPFRPVNIRAQKDPISLLEKVLEQDSRAYTKLEDLLEIGKNLILAKALSNGGASNELDARQHKVFEGEHKVTFLAINSALTNQDFDTAYSYITSRLSISPDGGSTSNFTDDTSWRAAYAAGKFRPQGSPKSVHERISGLSKRMDLLSLALTLAPSPDSLSEILGQWRRCEEEMDTLKKDALEEERLFEGHNDQGVPGDFNLEDRERDVAETKRALAQRSLARSTATYEEEAPMGLFDVARGAASAIRRSAFPHHGNGAGAFQLRDQHDRQLSDISDQESTPAEEGGPRVRKRDMVSNMVTSGLVSGMGWVLGAQPVDKHTDEQG